MNWISYSLFKKTTISKGSAEFQFYAELDQLLSFLGFCHLTLSNKRHPEEKTLKNIIKDCHNIFPLLCAQNPVELTSLRSMESFISKTQIPNHFIMEFSMCKDSLWINACRTQARKAELAFVRFAEEELKEKHPKVAEEIANYLNKLSKYLFYLLIQIQKENNQKEEEKHQEEKE